MTKELLQYLSVAENLFYYNNTYLGTPVYNTVLHFLVESKEVSACAHALSYVCYRGVQTFVLNR